MALCKNGLIEVDWAAAYPLEIDDGEKISL